VIGDFIAKDAKNAKNRKKKNHTVERLWWRLESFAPFAYFAVKNLSGE
jgi:hypothetical protein